MAIRPTHFSPKDQFSLTVRLLSAGLAFTLMLVLTVALVFVYDAALWVALSLCALDFYLVAVFFRLAALHNWATRVIKVRQQINRLLQHDDAAGSYELTHGEHKKQVIVEFSDDGYIILTLVASEDEVHVYTVYETNIHDRTDGTFGTADLVLFEERILPMFSASLENGIVGTGSIPLS